MSNSLRDEVKDAIRVAILDSPYWPKEKGDPIDLVCSIADEVFAVMGIPEDEQDLPVETAKEVIGLGRNQFANGWTAEDVHGHREELELPEWDNDKAERFLALLEKRLEGLSTPDGNALIEDELLDEAEHGWEYWERGR